MPSRASIPTIFAACTVLLATAGLSTALSTDTKPVSTGVYSRPLPPVSPARQPVRDLRIDAKEMEALAEQFVRQKKIPGMAMALVQNGKVLSARGYGVTSTVKPQPIRPDTVFRLASLSKAFAATLTTGAPKISSGRLRGADVRCTLSARSIVAWPGRRSVWETGFGGAARRTGLPLQFSPQTPPPRRRVGRSGPGRSEEWRFWLRPCRSPKA